MTETEVKKLIRHILGELKGLYIEIEDEELDTFKEQEINATISNAVLNYFNIKW